MYSPRLLRFIFLWNCLMMKIGRNASQARQEGFFYLFNKYFWNFLANYFTLLIEKW